MGAETPVLDLPYPFLSDPANGAAQLQALAEAVEAAGVAAGQLAVHVNNPVGAHLATAIAFEPSGAIEAEDVQAAIEEVDAALNAAVIAAGNVPIGGATGTVLVKASGADNDVEWEDLSTHYVPLDGAIVFLNDPAFGYVGDNVADDTVAIQAALTSLPTTGGRIVAPPGQCKTTAALVPPDCSVACILDGPGWVINNAVSDVFTWPTTRYYLGFENFKVNASGGHIFAPTPGASLSNSWMKNLVLVQNAITKSIFKSSGATNVIDLLVEGGDQYMNAGAVVPAWDMVCNANAINSNTWRRFRINAGGNTAVPFFYIEEEDEHCYDLHFEDITAEQCGGGIIECYGASFFTFSNISAWDLANYDRSLFKFGSSTTGGAVPRFIIGQNSGRRGGTLSGGAYDCEIVFGTVGWELLNVGPITGVPSYSIPGANGSAWYAATSLVRNAITFDADTPDTLITVEPQGALSPGITVRAPAVYSGATPLIGTYNVADTVPRVGIYEDGLIMFSDGANPIDVYLYRDGAGVLRLDGELKLTGVVRHSGAAMGFFGAVPIAKPLGVAVDVASLHAVLVAYGLIGA